MNSLEIVDILRLAQVCKRFVILFFHQRIWKRLCPPEIILHNSASRNYRIVFKEFMMASKLLMMPLLSFRNGGQEQKVDHCDPFTEFELEIRMKNLTPQHINYIKSYKKIKCPDEYSGLSFEWKLCLTQIRKSGNRDFSCTFSTFKTRDDQFYFQTFPFNPLTSLRHLKPGETSRQSFNIPMQWLLDEAKETVTQNPLFYYFKKKKIHKFRIYFTYTCTNQTMLNITDGTFQTTSVYISLNRGD